VGERERKQVTRPSRCTPPCSGLYRGGVIKSRGGSKPAGVKCARPTKKCSVCAADTLPVNTAACAQERVLY